MNENKILHVMILDKFLAPFIDFVDENFGRDNHHYVFITSEKYDYGLTPEHKVEFLHTDDDIFITLLKYMKMAKKIILHGLWRDKVDILLYFNQELLKKCYWVMWGGDFYFPEKQSQIKHTIVKYMGNLISGYIGEYELAKQWYGTKGKFHESFLYPSNLYKEIDIKDKKSNTINILLGNSATDTNQHLDAFEKLLPLKDKDIMIYVPLSYGDKNYGQEVSNKGKEIFGDKFIAIFDFMTLDKYLELLSKIDIGIFNHNRQQAAGNIISLLGMGKKVYLRNDNNIFKFLNSLSIEIYDIEKGIETVFAKASKDKNIEIIKNYFSETNLKNQWLKIIKDK